jgi:hypothetical protein
MTTEHEASRTLVKSPPELWAECSDAGSLARHLGEFGEIQITRLEPESTVAWEGEHVSGTVRIEPSGWGTRVTLTAQPKAQEQPSAAQAAEEASPPADVTVEASSPTPTPQEGESPVDVEPLTAEGESPTEESRSAQEASDATVEETLEDADPVPVGDTPRARARWRRLTARMRGLFGAAGPIEDEAGVDQAPTDVALPLEEPAAASEPPPAPEPEAGPELEATLEPDATPEPQPVSEPPDSEFEAEAILTSALDSLGQAHHRPFSRA